MSDFWSTAAEASERGEPFVVVTLLGIRGGAPQEVGAKALVAASGLRAGTVGGGKLEARAVVHGQSLLTARTRAPELVVWNLQRDIGMTCGGEVTMVFEPQGAAPWSIAVFGAGHVAQALVRALLPLSCRITCIDPREEWIARLPKHPRLRVMVASEPSACMDAFSADTFFVVMTQGHASDVPILERCFRAHPAARYVGVMGSEVKARKLRAELRERGIPVDLLERLRCPIGLRLGSNEPAEIAVSVVAELLQERDRASS